MPVPKQATKPKPKPKPKKAIPKKPVAKPKVAPASAPTPKKPQSNLISINNPDSTKKFKIENKAIYIIRSEHCFYCRDMKAEWNKATANNKNIKIYEIEAEYLNKIPTLNNIVHSYPTILRYYNGFQPYNNQRVAEQFSHFMRNG
jgi:outer membrane biosynthesis protein TonB